MKVRAPFIWMLCMALVWAGCELSPEVVDAVTTVTTGAAGSAAESAMPGTGTAASIVTGYLLGRAAEWLGVKGYKKIKKKDD